jgi:hypothetical protein
LRKIHKRFAKRKITQDNLTPLGRNHFPCGAFPRADFPVRFSRQRGGYAMWMQLFIVAFAVALALAVGAVALEAEEETGSGNLPARNVRRH